MNDDDPREIYLESPEDFMAFHSMIERCRDARGLRQYVACSEYPLRVGNSLFFCATGDPLAGTAYRRFFEISQVGRGQAPVDPPEAP